LDPQNRLCHLFLPEAFHISVTSSTFTALQPDIGRIWFGRVLEYLNDWRFESHCEIVD
jgi:hypothetical protein